MQQKTLNRIFKIPSHQEQMILSSSMNKKIYLMVSLKEFFKLFKFLASSGIDKRKNAVVECALLRIKKIYTQLFII